MEGYSQHIGEVVCRETHMSWVFLVDDKVLKLKKPVRFPYLDFSSVEKRRAACLAELSARARHGQIVDGHGDDVSDQLFTFYRCYRATLRARLVVAHLLEPAPRTPAKWPRQGLEYLDLARDDARRLQRYLG